MTAPTRYSSSGLTFVLDGTPRFRLRVAKAPDDPAPDGYVTLPTLVIEGLAFHLSGARDTPAPVPATLPPRPGKHDPTVAT